MLKYLKLSRAEQNNKETIDVVRQNVKKTNVKKIKK